MTMPLHPTWQEIAIRLALTMLAGAVIGFNRGAHGHAAGLRTTILVGLAAAVSMVQANILVSVGGKAPDSFAVMDVMRLPLGILTGVGFIGGGPILRRGDLVTGVTTAATLWVMTVIGLCFGGGQLALGAAATVLGVLTLWALKSLDIRIPREHRAMLAITSNAQASPTRDINGLIEPLGYRARFCRQSPSQDQQGAMLWFEIRWRRPESAGPPLDLLKAVEQNYALASFELTSEVRY